MSSNIIYEQPLNERIRAFLRLEFLFQQTRHHLGGPTPWDSRAALTGILEILSILNRSDLKTEVMKELERHTSTLARLEKNPEVDRKRLGQLLDELDVLIDRLHAINGQIGAHLKLNELLSSVHQRSAIPGGTGDFDLPNYHYWLEQPAEQRRQDLAAWFASFDTIAQSIELIMRLTRESSVAHKELAQSGFFQKGLDLNVPCQMVRVILPAGSPYFAEVSGGRHRFTVRLLEPRSADARPVQTRNDVEFRLACCII